MKFSFLVFVWRESILLLPVLKTVGNAIHLKAVDLCSSKTKRDLVSLIGSVRFGSVLAPLSLTYEPYRRLQLSFLSSCVNY